MSRERFSPAVRSSRLIVDDLELQVDGTRALRPAAH